MIYIHDILNDLHLFETRFLSEFTKHKLGDLPPDFLCRAVRSLQQFGPFPAYSTQRLWTPEGEDEPVLTIGSLAGNGAIRRPRFGFCVRDGGLYLWTDKETLENYSRSQRNPAHEAINDDWQPWRLKDTNNDFVIHASPVIDSTGEPCLLADHSYPNVEAFLRDISNNMQTSDVAIAKLAPQLDRLEQAQDAITPFVLDAFRHGDDEASDDVDDHILGEENASANLTKFVSVPSLNSSTVLTDGLTVTDFEAVDIFQCKKSAKTNVLDFMDVEFRPIYRRSEQAAGCGLYGMFFKTEPQAKPFLIYAGLFKNGKDGDPFSGDVFEMRWWKHLATMTMRDRCVGVAKATANYVSVQLANRALSAIAQSPARETIVKARGCMAGLRRVLFADAYWDQFANCEPADLPSYFSFTYVRLARPANKMTSSSAIRKRIAEAEKRTIKTLLPRCNKETPLYGGRNDVDRAEFIDVVISALNGTQEIK